MTKKQIATAIVAGLMAMGAGVMVTSFTQPEPEQTSQVQQVAQVVEQKPQKAVERNTQKEVEPQQKVVELNKVEAKMLAEVFVVQGAIEKLEPGMTSYEVGTVLRTAKQFMRSYGEDGLGNCAVQFNNYYASFSFENDRLWRVDTHETAWEIAEIAASDPDYNVTPNKVARITKNMPRGTVNQILGRKGITAFKAMNSAWYEDHQVWYDTNGNTIRIVFHNNRVEAVDKLDNHHSNDVALAHNGI